MNRQVQEPQIYAIDVSLIRIYVTWLGAFVLERVVNSMDSIYQAHERFANTRILNFDWACELDEGFIDFAKSSDDVMQEKAPSILQCA